MSTLTSFPVVEMLIGVVLRTSALLVLAFGVARLLRRGSAAARHLVWAAALTGAVLLPFLSATLPPVRIPLPDAVPSMVGSALNWSAPTPDRPFEETSAIGQATPGADQSEMTGAEIHNIAGGTWGEWAMLLWLAGALLMAVKLSLGVIGVARLGRRSSMLTDGDWLHLSHDLARRLGATRGVTLLHGEGPAVPMTWGVLQPVIWLPAEADRWTDERRRVVLAHELAHVRRRDALTQWVGHLAVAIYWFNPLVRIAARRLQEERERACDDAVLRLGTPSVSYADHLLDVARKVGMLPAPHAAMAMARGAPLVGRMEAILDRSTARDSVAGRRGLAIVALAAGCVLPLAALRVEGSAATVSGADGGTLGGAGSAVLSPANALESAPQAASAAGAGGAPAMLGPSGSIEAVRDTRVAETAGTVASPRQGAETTRAEVGPASNEATPDPVNRTSVTESSVTRSGPSGSASSSRSASGSSSSTSGP